MKTAMNFGGKLIATAKIENGFRQGNIPLPILFSMYLAMVFKLAFKDCHLGAYIRYRTNGKLFYVNDRDYVAHTEVDMH